MILVDPLPLFLRQQLLHNQLLTHGHHSHMLEAKVWLVSKVMFCLHFTASDHVLNPDAKLAIFIVARFIGEDVSSRERDFRILNTGANTDRPFMHVKVGADTVTGSVPVVEAFFPEKLASKGVESETGSPFGEYRRVKGYNAFKDESVGVAFHLCGLAEVHGSSRVGCAVQVLGTGVAEVDGFGVNGGAVAWFGLVVDYGCIGTGGRDGVEGEADEMFVFSEKGCQQLVCDGNNFVLE